MASSSEHVTAVHRAKITRRKALGGWEFPWDYVRALEMALYRTLCAPTSSALLDRTREFHDRPQRRYDDTSLLMAELIEWGYDSDRGREHPQELHYG